ncbi:MAG: 30S ribosomal protein S7 [Chloroflexi bacterium]|nr:30S ribosomal protein S7 [Chloroflexota bacterium]MDA1146919.1 30S ribosomal protein S7 [Chloroflexota bacterium]MQC82384.1 30S ribosomal protein S7 [Chloroflexota bacterium]MQC82974.1 30S ribosomal protein S7 [Chloroflexota bacterium]PKB56521.1 MAG: 30S ribosomal protein S7 [SAR202 cluster bacterium Casp-Chloro-G1]
MRRNQAPQRPVTPDPRYNSRLVAKFINSVMVSGKKSTAERVVYTAFAQVEERSGRQGIDIFEQAVRNVTPVIEVKPRRVGGTTYQVPIDIRSERRQALALRWLLTAARNRGGRSMGEKLASELLDAANNAGNAVRRKEEVHRMAEANRAFVHYRW